MAFKYYIHRNVNQNNKFMYKSHINTDTDLEPEQDDPIEITEEEFNSKDPTVFDIVNDDGSITTSSQNYKLSRQEEYPPLFEQLDKLYHDIDNGTLTTSGEFYTALNTVKTTYPKPSE